MRALVFGVTPEEFPEEFLEPLPADANLLEQHLRATPMGLEDLPAPAPLGPDWADASMTAFISFSQIKVASDYR